MATPKSPCLFCFVVVEKQQIPHLRENENPQGPGEATSTSPDGLAV